MIDPPMTSGTTVQLALLLGAAIMVVVVISRSIRIVPTDHASVVERLGRYHTTLRPGVSFIVPFYDRVSAPIDMRERVAPVSSQAMVTKDNVAVTIDTLVHFQVTDARAATYEIAHYRGALDQFAVTTLSMAIGSLSLAEARAIRATIGEQLCGVLDESTVKWGVRVRSVDPVTITEREGTTAVVVPAERRVS